MQRAIRASRWPRRGRPALAPTAWLTRGSRATAGPPLALTAAMLAVGMGLGAARTASAKTPSAPARLGQAWAAYQAGDYARARSLAASIRPNTLRNDDYRLYVLAQSRALLGGCRRAVGEFRALARERESRFSDIAAWRAADCEWELRRWKSAQRSYQHLLRQAARQRHPDGDTALAAFRIAAADAHLGRKSTAVSGLRRFLIDHPLHPEAEHAAELLRELGGSAELSAAERLEKARGLTADKKWPQAIAELERVGDDVPEALRNQRDYQLGMTLFRMRRQYARAGKILLGVYPKMGADAAKAMFHGARALSRADRDTEAIRWYERLVDEYPHSSWAPQALYLAGWLDFNRGKYRDGIPDLRKTVEGYPRSRWAREARWFLGMSYFLLGEYDQALPYFRELAQRSGKLVGGKGDYWVARTEQKKGNVKTALAGYTDLVSRYPFSWYALLARARLKEAGRAVGPFGPHAGGPDQAPAIATSVPARVARDDRIRAVDELISAGLGTFASYELRRSERSILRAYGREQGMATLLDRYRAAGDYNRPWMLAVIHGRRALDVPPKGRARIWWEHAYPRAFGDLVEKYRDVGKNPPLWLFAIMRKESGFDPNVQSYADARGLLQMIPATARRVTRELGLDYTADLLFDPEANIRTGSWYIGNLFHKFREQVPMAAGSFNSGPRAVMRWLEENGSQDTDVWVELVSYSQTRGYMKKVTETYARYLYLYENQVYEQPLTVNPDYVHDRLTF